MPRGADNKLKEKDGMNGWVMGVKGTGHEMRLGGALGPSADHAGAAPGSVLATF